MNLIMLKKTILFAAIFAVAIQLNGCHLLVHAYDNLREPDIVKGTVDESMLQSSEPSISFKATAKKDYVNVDFSVTCKKEHYNDSELKVGFYGYDSKFKFDGNYIYKGNQTKSTYSTYMDLASGKVKELLYKGRLDDPLKKGFFRETDV